MREFINEEARRMPRHLCAMRQFLVAATFAFSVVGCSDNMAGPKAETLLAKGPVSTTAWRMNGKLELLGRWTSDLELLRKDSVTITGKTSQFNRVSLSAAEVSQTRLAIEPRLLETALATTHAFGGPTGSAARGSAIFRPTFNRPEQHFKSPTGADISVQVLHSKRDPSRPPAAMLMFADGRAVVMLEFGYERRDGKWKSTRARSTFFDTRGGVQGVVDHDLTKVMPTSSNETALIPYSLLRRIGLAGQDFLAKAAAPRWC